MICCGRRNVTRQVGKVLTSEGPQGTLYRVQVTHEHVQSLLLSVQ